MNGFVIVFACVCYFELDESSLCAASLLLELEGPLSLPLHELIVGRQVVILQFFY